MANWQIAKFTNTNKPGAGSGEVLCLVVWRDQDSRTEIQETLSVDRTHLTNAVDLMTDLCTAYDAIYTPNDMGCI